MAENQNTTPTEETHSAAKKQKKVKVYIPRDSANGDPNVFVCINGKPYLIPKDEEVEVPAFVAEELNRSNKAKRTQNKNAEKKRLQEK